MKEDGVATALLHSSTVEARSKEQWTRSGSQKTADWFEAHLEEMMPAIEEKRRALAAYKACPSEYNLQALRILHSKVQQTARRYSNDYWLQLCSQI